MIKRKFKTIKPSDMNSLLASKRKSILSSAEKIQRINNHKGDGMYTDNIRYMPQRRNADRLEYQYVHELYDVLDELKRQGYEVTYNHSEGDYDLLDITFRKRRAIVNCYDVEDVDDLLVELEKVANKFKDTIFDSGRLARTLINIINGLVD